MGARIKLTTSQGYWALMDFPPRYSPYHVPLETPNEDKDKSATLYAP